MVAAAFGHLTNVAVLMDPERKVDLLQDVPRKLPTLHQASRVIVDAEPLCETDGEKKRPAVLGLVCSRKQCHIQYPCKITEYVVNLVVVLRKWRFVCTYVNAGM